MPLARPNKPARIRGMNAEITITTQDWGTSNSGMAKPQVGSTEPLIPCRIDTVSRGEARKYGHAVNETVYRLLCPVMAPDGSEIVLQHDQYVTVTSHPTIAANTVMQVNGDGQPEGNSGMQTVTLKREAK